MRLATAVFLLALCGCELIGPSDARHGIVVEGHVRDLEGEPREGVAIEVWLLRTSCADDPRSAFPGDDEVVSGPEGFFSGRFETLADGPIAVPCVLIRAMDGTGGVLADTLVEEVTEWTDPPSDTVTVTLVG